jgi:uncharacterized protein YabE (DUF348 family)
MKLLHRRAGILLVLLLACQRGSSGSLILVDGGQIHYLPASDASPAALALSASAEIGPADGILINGQPALPDQPLHAAEALTVEVRRAVNLTIVTPGVPPQILQTAAPTVGAALRQAGMTLHLADTIAPPADTAISGPLTVVYVPSRELHVTVDGKSVLIRSAAGTTGPALAEAGLPLLGLDTSRPGPAEPVPADGQIHITHVTESVVLAQKSLPFGSEFIASAEVELDQQQVLQPGQPGLSVSRVRIRYEDGREVSRQTESETLVRPPQNRVAGYGTKVVIRTTVVDGVRIEYWRAIQMFATSYSPCRSAADRCYPGTSSGKPVQKGVAAVVLRWYNYMQGQPIYVPGYGHATIEDVGGGIPGKAWIDLGYSDSDWQEWGAWVTVYFLTPAPANILNPLN